MDAPLVSRAAARTVGAPVVAQLAGACATVSLVVLTLAAFYVCIRRVAGGLVEPLPAGAMVAIGAALVSAALLFRLKFLRHTTRGEVCSYVSWGAPTIVLGLAAAALSLAHSPQIGLIGLWGVLALEESWSWERFLRRMGERDVVGVRYGATRKSVPLSESVGLMPMEVGTAADEAVTQFVVRRQSEQGREMMDGWVRIAIAEAQRHAVAHLAICPPFARTPRCYAEISDGPSGDVRIAQVLPYGVRIEVKLEESASNAAGVVVEFSIQEAPSHDGPDDAHDIAM